MFRDIRGLPITAENEKAVGHFDATVAEYLRFGTDAGPCLKQTLGADPEFPLAHCLRGYFMQLFAVPKLTERAGQSLEGARKAIADNGATDRERQHAAALQAWIAGDMQRTVDHWESILLEHPRDILALKLAHYIHFYLGDSARLRDSIARVRYAWDEPVPGFYFVLGMHAFGLEESGDYAGAERAGRLAVEHNPDDPWAVHAVAHVMEMQDRRREGIDWLRELEIHWSKCNNFAYHLWWHLTLFHLELEQYDEVLALYDQEVRSDESEEYLDICNAVSLLWRLEERGVSVGERWTELAEKCESRVHDHLLVFADVHFLMALAATGNVDSSDAMLVSMQQASDHPRTTQIDVIAAVGLDLARAVAAWYRGNYAAVVDHLLPVRYALPRIGGSHAQRDLFHQILIVAALRAGRAEVARALLSERTQLKPGNPWTWQRYGEALAKLNDDEGARAARRCAENLLAA